MDFVKILLYSLSPKLRKQIVEFVNILYVNSLESDNPLDKIIIGIFKQILDIKD